MSAAVPENAQKRRGRKGLIAAVTTAAVALLAALVAFALALSGMIAIPGITQASGELVLQGADEAGRDFFADIAAEPVAGNVPAPAAKPTVTGTTSVISGGAVGLYGGTNDNSRCDPAQVISFLGSNPDKAQAWVAALNADPQLQWGSGPLTTADIPAYIASLTPLVLLSDTVVTNHGFTGGVANPFQSVLQAGTAVLADRFGEPRVRCRCGNPLVSPAPVAATPTIVGTPWPGFDPAALVVIQQTVVVNNYFMVVPYPAGGTPVQVAAGNCVLGQPCASPWNGAPAATAPPTPAPSASATPSATPVDPSTVAQTAPVTSTCSVRTGSSTTPDVPMTVTNNSNVPIDIWWISDSCVPSHSGRLLPGEVMSGGVGYAGDVFIATSGTSTPLATWTLAAGAADFVYP